MSLDISDFTCPIDHRGRFEIPEKKITGPQLGLALALIGFTPIRVQESAHGRWLDVVGLSPCFHRVEPGSEIPVYMLEVIEHDDPEATIEPSINRAGTYYLELHLPREQFEEDAEDLQGEKDFNCTREREKDFNRTREQFEKDAEDLQGEKDFNPKSLKRKRLSENGLP